MADKKYKNQCDECGEAMCSYVYKGRNNNYLCGGTWYNKGCGQNICFAYGKREEEKFRWEYGRDCCDNKEMVKHITPMFSQFERDERDPERKLKVLYCEECKEEAKKSPLKWTEEDEEKERQREKEQKVQEKREREEKLNNQKNLFFLDGLVDKKSESKGGRRYGDYGFFLGRQNGQNYYLVIPFDHSIWKNETDPAIKKTTENFWWDGSQEDFFIIEGVENIPIEKSPSGYWKRLSKNENIFHKIVGLNDKITIIEFKEKSENNQKENQDIPISNAVKEYFQKNEVRQIFLEKEGLKIEYENGSVLVLYNLKDVKTPEVVWVEAYLKKTNKTSLTRKELDIRTDTTSPTKNNSQNDLTKKIIFGGSITIAILLVLGTIFLIKKSIKKK